MSLFDQSFPLRKKDHDRVAYSCCPYRRDQVEVNDHSFQQFLRGIRSGNIGILSDTWFWPDAHKVLIRYSY